MRYAAIIIPVRSLPRRQWTKIFLSGLFLINFRKRAKTSSLGKGQYLLDLFLISLRPAGVHHNIDSHLGKSVETLARGLAAAIERGRNLAKVRHAFEQEVPPHGTFDGGRSLLAHLKRHRLHTHRERQKQANQKDADC